MSFKVPTKHILSRSQLEDFQNSQTHADIVTFIEQLNESVIDVKLAADVDVTRIAPILNILEQVESIATQSPPIDNKASRFGNPAFRTFYDKVEEQAPTFHAELGVPEPAISELQVYFVNAWGNRERIDYGSGMELNFLCWLYCLRQLDVVDEREYKALVIRVFWRYIKVMRVLQSTYWLEPAGSHGVWGLDDYHFLPFLFGSAQLMTRAGPDKKRVPGHFSPRAIHVPDVVDELAVDYMYFACIQFINSIKTPSLRWHSPMLDDISAVKTWDKVNMGMIKMYKAEVLGKLPVAQHFFFGSILPYTGRPPPTSSEGGEKPRGHAHEGWGDCCGIPVPSAFAAAQAEGARPRVIEGPGIRPVPFD
ncbi:Phosphotyrosyl phosphatase activator [Boletus reticuloceps]|uniref:Serine/threonine-protein phosphatase 2A activator n=1 Tax=Boletus reticuloceps TaxID=495285 RepID=A0A8I2YYH9_9AGAM|nr:Phosphotyrosyl phosphatase activator [Boletus reticuloceps]